MQPARKDSTILGSDALSAPACDIPAPPDDPENIELRNFWVLVLFQVVLRIGWIFKTESVIMPAVVDSISGSGWVRGCLPMLNRFGQSVPPLMMARRIKIAPRKKWGLMASTSLMAFSFLSLSVIWQATGEPKPAWMSAVFLFFYGVFFISTGLNQISFGTVQGKLIRVNRRGRLLLMASVWGGVFSIGAALALLPLWLNNAGGSQFGMIFGFSGICFAGSAASALLLREGPDNYQQPRRSFWDPFHHAYETLRQDANFRRLVVAAALFNSSMILFPHYQALGREELHLSMDNLIWYVVIQNVGVALFSVPLGWLADRYGNRLVLRISILAICSAPISALLLVQFPAAGAKCYYLIFLMVGLTPMAIKTLHNYTLEICEPENHPRYLSTLGLCIAAPVFLSPLAGLLIDAFGFAAVFLGITALIFTGWLVTFRLAEPRHRYVEPGDAVAVAGGE